jgi:hypothetical protein
MKLSELRFIESWSRIRKNGRFRFALRTGITWSVITAFFTKIVELRRYSFSEVYFSESFLKFFSLFIIIGAMIFWKFVWELNEKKYHKLLKVKENEGHRK